MGFNYIKVDKKKIEKRNKKRDYTIPYHELLDPDRGDNRRKLEEFLKENEVILYHGMYPTDLDYEVFVGCMEIYKKIGVNYFYDFADLRVNFQHKTIDKGIKYYGRSFDNINDVFDDGYLDSYLEEVSRTIKLMEFFSIDNLYGTTIDQYKSYYNNAKTEWIELKQDELKKKKDRNQAYAEILKHEYFNFSDFNNSKFNRIYKGCIKDLDMGKNLYSFNDVLNINVQLENNKTFIVFLRKNNKVCFVGKTINLLNYIGVKNKEYEADSVAFYPVENNYIDEIYVRALIDFDLGYSGAVKLANRKYISLTTAKRVFKEIYKLNLTHIKKIIKIYDIEKYILGNTIIVDKLELDKAVRNYLNL